jgi:hypothetical protein
MAERQAVRRSELWTSHNDQMDRIERQLLELAQKLNAGANG